MKKKNDIQVIIDGQVITLSGEESSEYMQKVALYLNRKIKELKDMDSYRKLTKEYQNILLALNLSDDYFKVYRQLKERLKELDEKGKQLYDIKHDYIELQIQLENVEKEKQEQIQKLQQLNRQLEEEQKKYKELEQQLEEIKNSKQE